MPGGRSAFFQDVPGKEVLTCVYTRTEDANELGNTGMAQALAFFPFQAGRRYKIRQLANYASFLYAPALKGSWFSSLHN